MATTNIINAVFGSGICAVTTSAFRANYGMKLRFSGIDLPTAFEVDFSNYDVMGRDSITAIGQNNEVQIPDDLWDSGLNIYAYVYLHPTDDSGVTVYTVTIPVLGRPNRTEEQPTPHEQTLIEQAISALNDAVEQTAADVVAADASASAAAQSEANAATSERSAAASAGAALASQNAAESASQSATESATNASESAQNAAQSASTAAESATNAQASAEQAEQSAQSISGDVERAEQAATTATGKATEAATSATTANGAAQTATGKAANAEESATAAANSATAAATSASNAAASATAAQTAQTAAETAQGKADDAQAAAEAAAASIDPDTLVKKTELENYARIDGSYETMTVGNAEQLVATVGVDDNSPYNFRTSGGSVDIGDRETVNAVVGGTVAWNQLLRNGNFADNSVWLANTVTLSIANNIATFTRSDLTSTGRITANRNNAAQPYIANHKYLITGEINVPALTAQKIALRYAAKDIVSLHPDDVVLNAWNRLSTIFTQEADSPNTYLQIYDYRTVDEGDGLNSVQARNCMVIDLTALFGSTIADYIYSLEQSTVGAGVAYFRKLFPKDYYEYNAGELLSVNTSQHKMVGFNAYNPETGTAHVVGGMQYQITGAYTALSLDGETVTPDASGFFTPSANGTLAVTGGNSSTTCIHRVWSGYRNGEYEPYQEWVYPLDSSLTLRGIPKLDASNNLYYDGDTYAPDGTVTRRYGVVDLGTLTWVYNGSWFQSASAVPDAKMTAVGSHYTRITIDSTETSFNGATSSSFSQYGISGSGSIRVSQSGYSGLTNEEFKAAMNGVYIIYELATATTETATPYTQIQSVDDFGTEEYTDYAYENGDRDVAIPVGSNTLYPANLRDKLQHLPDLASADGYYMIQQSNNEMSLVLFRIPQASGLADGTYTLKATVASGTPTYTWVSDTAESEG